MYGNLDKNFKFPKHLKSLLTGTDATRAEWRDMMDAHTHSEKYRREGPKKRERETGEREIRSTTDTSSVAK